MSLLSAAPYSSSCAGFERREMATKSAYALVAVRTRQNREDLVQTSPSELSTLPRPGWYKISVILLWYNHICAQVHVTHINAIALWSDLRWFYPINNLFKSLRRRTGRSSPFPRPETWCSSIFLCRFTFLQLLSRMTHWFSISDHSSRHLVDLDEGYARERL